MKISDLNKSLCKEVFGGKMDVRSKRLTFYREKGEAVPRAALREGPKGAGNPPEDGAGPGEDG